MTRLVSLGGAVGWAGLVYMLIVLGRLSRRLGDVVKMPRYYRWFYVAACLVGWTAASQFAAGVGLVDQGANPTWWLDQEFAIIIKRLPLGLGLLIGLATAWHYWSWLLRER